MFTHLVITGILPDKYGCSSFINERTEGPRCNSGPRAGVGRPGPYSQICHSVVEWPWESCLLSVTSVDLALIMLKSPSAVTPMALVYSTPC